MPTWHFIGVSFFFSRSFQKAPSTTAATAVVVQPTAVVVRVVPDVYLPAV